LTYAISPENTYDTEYINKPKRRQPDIGRQIPAIMLRFEQLLGITVDCECCSRKYKEKIASSRANEPTAENTEFYNEIKGRNT
jgi:bacterioferritin-associated ferredoxin